MSHSLEIAAVTADNASMRCWARTVVAVAVSAAGVASPHVAHGAEGDEYVVEDGDYLIGIADDLGVPLARLLSANSLSASSLIFPGQRLAVPGASGDRSGQSGGHTYIVKEGDWLGAIAARHGVTLDALVDVNDLSITNVIVPGQKLTVPGGSPGTSPAAPSGQTYTVRAGDSLIAIANRHNVTLDALLAVNHLSVTNMIVPGQRLTIPGSSPGTSPAAPSGQTYTVRAGDTLIAIANRHKVALDALLAVNDLSASNVIMPGMELDLPAGARAAPAKVSDVDRVVNYALAQVGKPYRFFTKGPHAFDCSGLTLAAYARAGVTLIHYSGSQAQQGRAVDFWSEPIRAGDLVFVKTHGSSIINHVGMAVNSSTWVHGSETAGGVVTGQLPHKSRIVAVRRFLPTG